MRAPHVVLVGTLSAATLLAVPAAATESHRWEKSYAIADRPDLVLKTDDGHVRVRAWDRHSVSVRVSTVGWSIGERGVRIEESQTGDRVQVDARTPRFGIAFGIVVRSLTIEVWVPRETDLVVESGDGPTDVAGIRGQLSIRSGDGRIVVDDVGGTMRLRSADGRIVGTGLDGALEAGTTDGAIRVEGRFDALALSTTDGGISAEALPGSRLQNGWSLSTVDGRLRLGVPGDLRARIDAHTGDGAIDVALPLTLTSVSRHDVQGALNGGGPTLRLRTTDGSLRVAAR